jgi:hypothetical protein
MICKVKVKVEVSGYKVLRDRGYILLGKISIMNNPTICSQYFFSKKSKMIFGNPYIINKWGL